MLKGKNAIITGARSGIGLATVKTFAGYGANVWALIRDENDAEFKREAEELSEKYGVWIKPISVDLGDEASIKAAIKRISDEKVSVDVLCNIAGVVGVVKLFHMTTIAEMKRTFDINFFAQIQIAQLVSRIMMKQRKGSIVNVSSTACDDPGKGQIDYAPSKAAIRCATVKEAGELADYGIRVNCVVPGLTETKMSDTMDPKVMSDYIEGTLLKRKGRPEEIAEVIAFVASDRASFVNAETIFVDGGR